MSKLGYHDKDNHKFTVEALLIYNLLRVGAFMKKINIGVNNFNKHQSPLSLKIEKLTPITI